MIARLRRAALVAAAAFVTLATLALGARSGLPHLWCAPMQQVRTHCCCPTPSAEERATDRIGVQCCEERTAGVMPSATSQGAAHTLVAAPCVGIVPLVIAFAAPVLTDDMATHRPREARAGPGQRAHARHSVYLL